MSYYITKTHTGGKGIRKQYLRNNGKWGAFSGTGSGAWEFDNDFDAVTGYLNMVGMLDLSEETIGVEGAEEHIIVCKDIFRNTETYWICKKNYIYRKFSALEILNIKHLMADRGRS